MDEKNINLLLSSLENDMILDLNEPFDQCISHVIFSCISRIICSNPPCKSDDEDVMMVQSCHTISRSCEERLTYVGLLPKFFYDFYLGFKLQFSSLTDSEVGSWDIAYHFLANYSEKHLDDAEDRDDVSKSSIASLLHNTKSRNVAIDDLSTILYFHTEKISPTVLFCLWLIHKHPLVLQEIMEEISRFKKLDYRSVFSCLNLFAVVKETIRLFPSMPIITKTALKNTDICGYYISKDTNIFVSVHGAGRLDNDTLESFDPFTLSTKESFPLGFGSGKQQCIGKDLALIEISAIVISILRNYEIVINSDDLLPKTKTDGFFLKLLDPQLIIIKK